MLGEFYQALIEHRPVADFLYRVRDLTCWRLHSSWQMVVACDSLGAIGEKPLDIAQASARTVGHFSLRVPLIEVIAAGAKPFLIIDALSIEISPYSQNILAGIKELAAEIGLQDEVHFNCSMEKNVFPLQTGVGITVIGLASMDHLQIGTAKSGDMLLLVGKPKSAPTHEVRIGDSDIVSLQQVEWLRSLDGVHEMVPVGSNGVMEETRQLADSVRLRALVNDVYEEDAQSGGPHTSMIVSCDLEAVELVMKSLDCPVRLIGKLVE